MELADPATIQAFETPVVNANFMKLENGIVADRVRITAAEGAITTAQGKPAYLSQITEFEVTDLAALDAIANAFIGDTAIMTTPGTGISQLKWEAIAGSGATIDWQPVRTVVADTKDHLDTFIAAVALLTADLKFEVGAYAYVTGTKLLYKFTSVAGTLSIMPQPIVPTATATGGAAVADAGTGVVTVTGSCTILDLDGIPADATEIRLIMNATFSTALGFSLQLRAAGVVENSGSSGTTGKYDQEFHGASASTPSASPVQALTAWAFGGGAVEQDATIVLRRVGEAVRTMGEGQFYSTQNPQTAPQVGIYGLQHRNGTTYDGIRIALSGAGTMVGKFAIEVTR